MIQSSVVKLIFKSEMFLILGLVILSSSAVTAVNVSNCDISPTGKVSVDIDVVGVPSPEGPKGDQDPHGYLGDTSQCEKIRKIEQTELDDSIKSTFTKCGIYSLNWRRVTYIDTTQGKTCPDGLREVSDSASNKRACGRTVDDRSDGNCSSLTFPSGGNYTHVCGRARGYQLGHTDAFANFKSNKIDHAYVDGLSITRGSPRKHIWSYAAGHHEKINSKKETRRCPCAGPGYNNPKKAPFVGEDYYCESAFLNAPQPKYRIVWEDPLWDGEGCTQPNNTCCQRSGWFHKEVPTTTDYIEVRWCCDVSMTNEDVFTDIVEIWVK